MSYKATKPGLVSGLYVSIHYMVSSFIRAPFYVLLGRLPKVDLIILEGENVRPSVRSTSVRPQKVSSI